MTDHPAPPPIPPLRILTRPPAARSPRRCFRPPTRAVPGALVADTLDATAAAVLRVAGVDNETGRTVCASLWSDG
jgi:hypothetical protein